jgi:hypothetical protein
MTRVTLNVKDVVNKGTAEQNTTFSCLLRKGSYKERQRIRLIYFVTFDGYVFFSILEPSGM